MANDQNLIFGTNESDRLPYDYAEFSSTDNEIYSFQCPESFDKQTLMEKINLRNNLKILPDSNSNQKFTLNIFNVENDYISVAFPTNSKNGLLVKVPLCGHIVIQKAVSDSANIYETTSVNENNIQFPKGIKRRHPLLGANWKSHVSLAENSITKRVSEEDSLGKKMNINMAENPGIKLVQMKQSASGSHKKKKIRKTLSGEHM
ncbi:hypothetical protein RUM44_000033 [Polyplax serrata]|uniref:Uncharacterized protein n=1 Tax=Polyplax serrata TaxID=468196 RepID=A0ABR1B4C6_POLSC